MPQLPDNLWFFYSVLPQSNWGCKTSCNPGYKPPPHTHKQVCTLHKRLHNAKPEATYCRCSTGVLHVQDRFFSMRSKQINSTHYGINYDKWVDGEQLSLWLGLQQLISNIQPFACDKCVSHILVKGNPFICDILDKCLNLCLDSRPIGNLWQ